MQNKSVFLLKILLNRYGKGPAESVLKTLPEEIVKQIAQVSILANDPKPLFEQPLKLLYKMHYSWLMPHIQKFPKEIHPAIISSLSKHQCDRLKVLLNLKGEILAQASLVKSYIVHSLYHFIKGTTEVLPPEYLPPSSFISLGNWEKRELVELIEFLGIHDLSEEMRRILDKKILKNAYNCLSLKEQQYLRKCLHLKEKIATPSLGLDKWKGEEEKLKSVLQTRGLVRLGKGLSGDHPDLIWNIAHTLDIGRGQTLLKYYSETAIPGITAALSQQVSNLMNFLKNKE